MQSYTIIGYPQRSGGQLTRKLENPLIKKNFFFIGLGVETLKLYPGPPDFPRMPNIRLRVSPDAQNLPSITRSRDNGGGPYYPVGPYSPKFPYCLT